MTAPTDSRPADPQVVLRSRRYVGLLVLAAVIGVPISAAAYGFLTLVDHVQDYLFTDLPRDLGYDARPAWWPVPLLTLCGLTVALALRYLPGTGGHSPVDGLRTGAPPATRDLPGVLLAALATLCLGAVLGPEAPLIALGAGAAALTIRLARRDVPARTEAVVGAAGSFAAVSTLLGSPLLGAFLLMEASGLAGATMVVVLLPGLLAAGVGDLVFTGLGSWTGFGTFSLALPSLPEFGDPDLAMFGWALVIGLAAAVLGAAIRRLGLVLRPLVERRMVLHLSVAGLTIGALAVVYGEGTDRDATQVLFSGQDALGPLAGNAETYTVGALLLLMLCKGLAYGISLSGFRGGPVFPAMFIGAAGGIALSHLPGLPMVAGLAMGIGAMCAVMLRLPLTSVLLATLLLSSNGLAAMPLVIVAVAVAYVAATHLDPMSPHEPVTAPAPATSSDDRAAAGAAPDGTPAHGSSGTAREGAPPPPEPRIPEPPPDRTAPGT